MTHAKDLPWNDAPADAGLPAEVDEPDPGEVEGEDFDGAFDASLPHLPTPDGEYHRDTLDERLAEEEPETRPGRGTQDAEAGGLIAPIRGGGDVELAEAHSDAADDDDSAEDAAIHVRDDDRAR